MWLTPKTCEPLPFLFPATLHQQVVGAASVGFQHAFHLELEEEGGELADGNVGLHGDDVLLQVVGRAEQVDHLLLLGREVGEELALDAVGLGLLQLGVGLPTHGGHEVGGRGDEGGAVVAYQIVAPIAVGGAHVAGEGEDAAVVVLGCGYRIRRCNEAVVTAILWLK